MVIGGKKVTKKVVRNLIRKGVKTKGQEKWSRKVVKKSGQENKAKKSDQEKW